MNEEKLIKVISILEQSDIVWEKYGSETKEALAKKILLELDKDEF